MKKIIADVPMKFPGKKGKVLRLNKGDIIEKPTSEQLKHAEENPNCCKILEPEKKKGVTNGR